ncbi:HigA family addiction module antitoxin [Vibrio nigripulchritudo]|uniref:HigA family addiction module antitoxin n=1 Tax=Vibrio nigripulchritudo TaxID=28173 RepID=UPI00069664F9|nr:HigA family addiction module antitoxin [Vibrio nigripulchritudo]
MKMNRKPTHPGEFFKEEILEERGISVTKAAESLGVTRKALSTFINGHSKCSHTMARRLAAATGTGVAFWINMQAKLDIWEAEHMTLEQEASPLPVASVA